MAHIGGELQPPTNLAAVSSVFSKPMLFSLFQHVSQEYNVSFQISLKKKKKSKLSINFFFFVLAVTQVLTIFPSTLGIFSRQFPEVRLSFRRALL